MRSASIICIIQGKYLKQIYQMLDNLFRQTDLDNREFHRNVLFQEYIDVYLRIGIHSVNIWLKIYYYNNLRSM